MVGNCLSQALALQPLLAEKTRLVSICAIYCQSEPEEQDIPQRIVTMVCPEPNSLAIISAATTFNALDAPIYNLKSGHENIRHTLPHQVIDRPFRLTSHREH
jgi:hypothetical protein